MDTHPAEGKQKYRKDPRLMIKLEGLIERYPVNLKLRDQFKVIHVKRKDGPDLLLLQYKPDARQNADWKTVGYVKPPEDILKCNLLRSFQLSFGNMYYRLYFVSNACHDPRHLDLQNRDCVLANSSEPPPHARLI
jgi:hypothetical protein